MTNNNIVPANLSESPFDTIRRFDDNGNEYWLARELQKLLGYRRWDSFISVIEMGSDNLESAGEDVTHHIISRTELSTASNPAPLQDYKLSRLACYHIALACDSRGKPEVKLAKHYFAVKTREAELAPKSSAEMLVAYAQMFLEQERRQLAIEAAQKIQAEEIAQLKLINETQDLEISANTQELDRFKNGHGYWFSIAGWCAKLGVKKSLNELNALGRQASALCRMREINPEKVSDPRWGTVGCYPDSVLMELAID
jgi:DNA-damage-inducible protein D